MKLREIQEFLQNKIRKMEREGTLASRDRKNNMQSTADVWGSSCGVFPFSMTREYFLPNHNPSVNSDTNKLLPPH
jgi:hypothetical protein